MKKVFKNYKAGLVVMGMIALLSCAGAGGDRSTFEYMPDMANSPAIKAQEEPRMPSPGAVSRNYPPYPFAKEDGDRAGTILKNNLPRTRQMLYQGKHLFETYCAVCHGTTGKGNGFIVPKFPQPPSLHSEKVTNWSDGRIFHVITAGQNLMPSYASQVFPAERWAIINYLRVLQRSVSPTDADVETYNKKIESIK